MSKNEVVGRTVWVTRDNAYKDFEVWSKKPRWSWAWERRMCEAQYGLTSACPELFRKWLGVYPPAHLKAGGPKAIQRATLYVGLDWEGLR